MLTMIPFIVFRKPTVLCSMNNVVFKLPLSVVLLYTSKMQIDEDSNELRINEFDCIIVISDLHVSHF